MGRLAGHYSVKCYDQTGQLKWEDECDNALFDEGEQIILDLSLRGAALSSWYIGLLKTSLASLPAETTTLSGLPVSTHEPSNATEPGYARQAVARDATAAGWPTLALDTGDYQAISKTISITATNNWAGVIRWMFLTTNGTTQDTTGKLVSIAQLTVDRTIVNGDQLNVFYKLKLQ